MKEGRELDETLGELRMLEAAGCVKELGRLSLRAPIGYVPGGGRSSSYGWHCSVLSRSSFFSSSVVSYSPPPFQAGLELTM